MDEEEKQEQEQPEEGNPGPDIAALFAELHSELAGIRAAIADLATSGAGVADEGTDEEEGAEDERDLTDLDSLDL